MKKTLITLTYIAALSSAANAQTYTPIASGNWLQNAGGPATDGKIQTPNQVIMGDSNKNTYIQGLADFGLISFDPSMTYTLAFNLTERGNASTLTDGFEIRFYDTALTSSSTFSDFNGTPISRFANLDPNYGASYSLDVTSQILANSSNSEGITARWVINGLDISENGIADGYVVSGIKLTATVVPEPSSTLLLGLSSIGFLARRKRS